MSLAKSQQSLKSWTKQKWRTKSGKPSTHLLKDQRQLVNVTFLLQLLSLLAAVSMPLQPQLKEKARLQVSSMWLNLKALQRKRNPLEPPKVE
jgi:hypothetical protein